MHWTSKLATLALAGLCIVSFGCGKGNPPRANVVLITIDTLRADRVGAYGYASAGTPNLDRLAGEGVLFTHAYSQVPLTLPSHASILTGLYPPEHGARLNGAYTFHKDTPTIATILKGEAYSTGAFVSAFVLHRSFGLDEGFDVYDDQAMETHLDVPERGAEETVSHALEWLEAESKDPFFLWVHLYDPHYPYAPPEPFATEFAANPYDGEIAAVDAAVGRLIDFLEERELLDRTLIVATSDHGEGFGEHGELTHGLLIYDSTMHIPLIIRPPSNGDEMEDSAQRGRKIDALVESIDIAPTVLDVLGIDSPGTVSGMSILPEPQAVRSGSYGESLYPLVFRWSPLYSWREDGWKYIRALDEELFDTQTDPAETQNRIEEGSTRAHTMDAALKEFREAREAPEANDAETAGEWQNLESLGYLGGAAPAFEEYEGKAWPDPRARIDAYHQIFNALNLLRDKRSDAAIGLLLPMLPDEKDNPYFRKILGLSYLQKQDLDPAIEHLRQFYELSSHDSDAVYDLSLALTTAKRIDEARTILEEGLESVPRYGRGWDLLAIIHASAGNVEAALEAGDRALEIEPTNRKFYLHLGSICMDFNRFKKAEALFAEALEIFPDDPVFQQSLEEARSNLEAGR